MNSQNNLTNLNVVDATKIEVTPIPQPQHQVTPNAQIPKQTNMSNQTTQPTEPTFQYSHNTKEENERIYGLQKEVAILNEKLKKSRISISLPFFFLFFVIINAAWFLGVRFYIVPKYEEQVKISEQIKKEYDTLKRKIDAIVGTEE